MTEPIYSEAIVARKAEGLSVAERCGIRLLAYGAYPQNKQTLRSLFEAGLMAGYELTPLGAAVREYIRPTKR